MKRNTVQRGLSDRTVDGGEVGSAVARLSKATKTPVGPVKEGNVATTLNEELIPVIKELRTKANLELREEGVITTAGDGVYTEVWRSPVLETNGVYGLYADVKWSSADQNTWARCHIRNSIASVAGVVALVMVDAGEIHYTAIGLMAQWQADAVNRQVVLQIKDDAVSAMTAKAHVTMGAREV